MTDLKRSKTGLMARDASRQESCRTAVGSGRVCRGKRLSILSRPLACSVPFNPNTSHKDPRTGLVQARDIGALRLDDDGEALRVGRHQRRKVRHVLKWCGWGGRGGWWIRWVVSCIMHKERRVAWTMMIAPPRNVRAYLEGVVLVEVCHLQRAEEGVEPRVGELERLHLEGRLGREAVCVVRGKEGVSVYTCRVRGFRRTCNKPRGEAGGRVYALVQEG